jgi:N-acetylmuramoyl-L-alanine amidase
MKPELEDRAVSLAERSSLANKDGCDYFISFHRNAFQPEQAKGVETFVYTCPQCTKSVQLAEKIQKALVGDRFCKPGC